MLESESAGAVFRDMPVETERIKRILKIETEKWIRAIGKDSFL